MAVVEIRRDARGRKVRDPEPGSPEAEIATLALEARIVRERIAFIRQLLDTHEAGLIQMEQRIATLAEKMR